MKNYWFIMNKSRICLWLGVVLLLSCSKGKDGAPGPKGVTGPVGPTGLVGAPGPDGLPPYEKGGFITGHITGQLTDGTAIDETFKSEYSYSTQSGTFSTVGDQYFFSFARYDSVGNKDVFLDFYAPLDLSSGRLVNGSFYLSKDLGNNQLMTVYGGFTDLGSTSGPSGATFTGLAYNATTGLFTGTYSWNVGNYKVNTPPLNYFSYTSNGTTLTISGTFSIPMKERVFRKGE